MQGIVIVRGSAGQNQKILLPNYTGVIYNMLKQVNGTVNVDVNEIVMTYSNALSSNISGFYTTLDITDYKSIEFAVQADEISSADYSKPCAGVFNRTPENFGQVALQFYAYTRVIVSPGVVTYSVDISALNGNKIIGMLGGLKGKCVGIVLRG